MQLSARRFGRLLLVVPLGTAVAAFAMHRSSEPPAPPPPPPFQPLVEAAPIGPEPDFAGAPVEGLIENGDSLSTAAARIGVGSVEVDELVRALKGTFDFRNAQPGHRFELLRNAEAKLIWFRYTAGPRAIYQAWRDHDGVLKSLTEDVTVLRQTVYVTGEIDHSLYLAMAAAGEQPGLTMLLVDLFAWDIDFYTETQKGDRFKLLVEKEFVDGQFVSYGKILGAEYSTLNGRTARAFHYTKADGSAGYYTPDGTSVKKAFLKSPIQFASITSSYGMRRHPILKYVRAHRGVDYGAPKGTAIWAVADGVVTHAGWRGGYGNVVILKHANGLESRYAHLSGFGKNVRVGRRVEQKQIIGYVGKTGLATGPHLHYEVLQHGHYMNPTKVAVPPAPPIASEEMPLFRDRIAPVLSALEMGTPALALQDPSK